MQEKNIRLIQRILSILMCVSGILAVFFKDMPQFKQAFALSIAGISMNAFVLDKVTNKQTLLKNLMYLALGVLGTYFILN